MHGAAMVSVVHVCVAEVQVTGVQKVAGVGEPDVGIVFKEKRGSGMPGMVSGGTAQALKERVARSVRSARKTTRAEKPRKKKAG